MPQTNKIDVEIYPSDDPDDEPIVFTDVNFISLVASGNSPTYGIPAVIAEEKYKSEGLPLRVLYINPANVAAFLAERKA